jgi:hypothetical protein
VGGQLSRLTLDSLAPGGKQPPDAAVHSAQALWSVRVIPTTPGKIIVQNTEGHARRHLTQCARSDAGNRFELDDSLLQPIVVQVFTGPLTARMHQLVDDGKPLFRLGEAGFDPDLVAFFAHVQEAVERSVGVERDIRQLPGQRPESPQMFLPDDVPPARQVRNGRRTSETLFRSHTSSSLSTHNEMS